MRRAVLATCAAVLLVGPAVLALPAGGYGDEARILAGALAWLLAAAAVVAAPDPLPRARAGRVALAGLAVLAALTLLSALWAPIVAQAWADGQRVLLYLGVFVLALAVLSDDRVLSAVEPALVACAVFVTGYGLSERIVPWLVTLTRSPAAGGRLNAPLGYWNAAGAVAAVGLVLAAALAADPGRALRTRASAAAAAPLLGAGIALSFSRGALLAAAVGSAVVLLVRSTAPQARSLAVAYAAAIVAGVVAASLHGVARYAGTAASRDAQGAIAGVVIVVLALAAAGAQVALARREGSGRLGAGTLPRRARAVVAGVATVAVIAAGVALVAGESGSSGQPQFGANAGRLSSVQSNRYAYWKVAARTFVHHPLAGVGASGFAVEWLQHRTIAEGAHDAHSLPLETAAELGLLGLAALFTWAGGVAVAARRAARSLPPGATAGLAGGLAAWTAHACIDWAWEMPADTLFGLILAASLVALAGVARADDRARAKAPAAVRRERASSAAG
jgi:hypothetical protein